jgi:hypothetical protein
MAITEVSKDSTRDNLIQFPERAPRLQPDVPPFDPSNVSHLRAWEALWDYGQSNRSHGREDDSGLPR